MGAWGPGIFENDDACDLEARLAASGAKALDHALSAKALGNRSDDGPCAAALAACEVIAAASGHPMRGFATQAAAAAGWLAEAGYRPSERTRERSLRVARQILAGSALADLWNAAGEARVWRRAVESLVRRLEKPAKAVTVATRSTSTRPTLTAKKPTSRAPAGTPSLAAKPVAAITSRAAKQLLVKKADGWLDEPRRSGGVEVTARGLSKMTQADARALATLADVRWLDLRDMKLGSDKRHTLEILLDGWSGLSAIEAGDTKGVARVLCERAAGCNHLTSLDLSHSDVTATDLGKLAGHPTLERLDISETAVTDAVFRLAGEIPRLESLRLADCRGVTIPAAAAFAARDGWADRLDYTPHASQLGVTEPSPARQQACSKRNMSVAELVTGTWKVWVSLISGHIAFGELPDVERLALMARECLVDSLEIGINQSPIRNEEADRLRFVLTAWPKVRRLNICGAKTLDDSMATAIGGLADLETLELHQVKIGDAAMPALGRLKKLRWLSLDQTQVTAKSLPTIAKLPQLRWLQLSTGPGLSREAVEQLRKKLKTRCYVDCLA